MIARFDLQIIPRTKLLATAIFTSLFKLSWGGYLAKEFLLVSYGQYNTVIQIKRSPSYENKQPLYQTEPLISLW